MKNWLVALNTVFIIVAFLFFIMYLFGVFDDPTIPEPVEIVGVSESASGDKWEQVVTYKGKTLHCIAGYHNNLDCDFVRYHKENNGTR